MINDLEYAKKWFKEIYPIKFENLVRKLMSKKIDVSNTNPNEIKFKGVDRKEAEEMAIKQLEPEVRKYRAIIERHKKKAYKINWGRNKLKDTYSCHIHMHKKDLYIPKINLEAVHFTAYKASFWRLFLNFIRDKEYKKMEFVRASEDIIKAYIEFDGKYSKELKCEMCDSKVGEYDVDAIYYDLIRYHDIAGIWSFTHPYCVDILVFKKDEGGKKYQIGADFTGIKPEYYDEEENAKKEYEEYVKGSYT